MGILCLVLCVVPEHGLEGFVALGAGMVRVLDDPLVEALPVEHMPARQLHRMPHNIVEAHRTGPIMHRRQLPLGNLIQIPQLIQCPTNLRILPTYSQNIPKHLLTLNRHLQQRNTQHKHLIIDMMLEFLPYVQDDAQLHQEPAQGRHQLDPHHAEVQVLHHVLSEDLVEVHGEGY